MTTCGKPNCYAQPAYIDGRKTRYCILCDKELTATESAPDIEEVEDPNAYEGLEKYLVSAIVRALEYRGATVFRISQLGGKGSGTTIGTPDLFCSVQGGQGLFRGLEIKTKKGTVQPAQAEFARRGATVIVRSVEAALRVCGYN